MIRLVVAALSLVAATAAAQINEVPMQGEGNDWVKQLELRGRLDWEWMRT
ncbi:MAG: hypothetical protein ACO3LH_06710 [Steroidobacteraceae bacterium]